MRLTNDGIRDARVSLHTCCDCLTGLPATTKPTTIIAASSRREPTTVITNSVSMDPPSSFSPPTQPGVPWSAREEHCMPTARVVKAAYGPPYLPVTSRE